MSMTEYPVNDTALVITPDLAPYIILFLDKTLNQVPAEVQAAIDSGTFAAKVASKDLPVDYLDVAIAAEALESLASVRMTGGILTRINDLCSHSEFTGSATTLTGPAGENDVIPRSFEYDGDFVAYLPTEKGANLFCAAYASIDELVQEFRERLGDAIPNDVDLRPFLVEIVGTYFG